MCGCRSAAISSLAVAVVLVLVLAAQASAGAARLAVRAARTVSLSESGRLRLTSKHSFTLNERGTATGTIGGTIYIHLHIVASNRVTAEVNIYPSGGSLSGYGSAAYAVRGSFASFSGSLAITRGTGRYARARASRLRFGGTIRRRDDAVSVQLSGPLSL